MDSIFTQKYIDRIYKILRISHFLLINFGPSGVEVKRKYKEFKNTK